MSKFSRLVLPSDVDDGVRLLGRRIKLARLRRNLSQAEMARRAGVSRVTWIALESGKGTTSLALLARAMELLGYAGRLPALLESDPIGEDLDVVFGRQRGGARDGLADF